MKKLIIVLLVSLGFALNASAQFGVVVGYTSTKSNLKDLTKALGVTENVANSNLYNFGVTYKFPIYKDIIVLQPALLYNVKGIKIGDAKSFSTLGNSLEVETGYLELPVQLQAGVPIGEVVRIYGLVEPYAGIAVINEMKGSYFGKKLDKGTRLDVSNKLEYGVSVGGGVELFESLQFSVKYFTNFGDMYNMKPLYKYFEVTAPTTESKEKSNGVIISLAWIF